MWLVIVHQEWINFENQTVTLLHTANNGQLTTLINNNNNKKKGRRNEVDKLKVCKSAL